MAKRARFKPSAKAICNLPMMDNNRHGDAHITDLRNAGRGMLPWLQRHGHIKSLRNGFYNYTFKGKKLVDKACNIEHGFTASGKRRKR